MRKLIEQNDLKGIAEELAANPALANEGLPYDEANTTKAHPLHRISDGVFSNQYSGKDAVEMAKIFLAHGANINGTELIEKQDTPLLAASSLHADELAVFFIDEGADINHPGCHGGTALHWAAWCGRPVVVKRLLQENPSINKRCIDFQSTPLFWAVHGLKNGSEKNTEDHFDCIRMLINAGADKTIPNADGQSIFDLCNDTDIELKKILAASPK